MGLFNKLKNILFEEEEIEETSPQQQHQRKHVKQEDQIDIMELPKISKEPEKKEIINNYDFEEETDKELFKSERTFDFPAFDEDEFEDLLPKKEVVEKPKEIDSIHEKYKKDLEPPKKRDTYISVRMEKPKEEIKKNFEPSPVISPVYGILDKNYRKEDVLTRDEKLAGEKVKLDVDSVRKKAFGTLEENLDTTITETDIDFNTNKEAELKNNDVIETIEEENLDNLLEDTVDVEIDVTKEMEIPSRTEKITSDEIEEDEIDELEVEEDVDNIEETEEAELTENTEENDLFDLIDSMYDNKEEE